MRPHRLVTAERDADSVSPRAVLILERIGRDNDLPPAWWHEAGPDGQRRMARPLREVLDDLHRLGRA